MDFQDPKIQSALIAATVSLITMVLGFLFKAWYEKNFFNFRLEAEFRHDHKKKIKEELAKHKTKLLDAGESLNNRLWNFSENYPNNWHKVENLEQLLHNYYLSSFVYRLLSFFSWVHRIESNMVHLDTTIASKDDLNFVKFLRLLGQTLCEVELFKGFQYDNSYAIDHFFHNEFVSMCDCFIADDEEFTFSKFKERDLQYLRKIETMFEFLNGINPEEDRLRWERLQCFHFVLLMFLNSYGYDFQYTDAKKIHLLLSRYPNQNRLLKNLEILINRICLNNQPQVKKVLRCLLKHRYGL